MYAPIAASLARRATADIATSALPDAPVRPDHWSQRRRRTVCLPGVVARLLAGHRLVRRPTGRLTAQQGGNRKWRVTDASRTGGAS